MVSVGEQPVPTGQMSAEAVVLLDEEYRIAHSVQSAGCLYSCRASAYHYYISLLIVDFHMFYSGLRGLEYSYVCRTCRDSQVLSAQSFVFPGFVVFHSHLVE